MKRQIFLLRQRILASILILAIADWALPPAWAAETVAQKNNAIIIPISNLTSLIKPVKTLGHSDNVNSVAFSPDRKILASGSHVTIILWDAATGDKINTLKGYSKDVTLSLLTGQRRRRDM